MNAHDTAVVLTLAKLLVAAAWADGHLDDEEINTIKRDLLARIPDLTTQQWASVAIYIDSAVDDAERARLVEQLRAGVTSSRGKQLVLQALDDLVAADGRVSDAERRVIDEVKAALEGAGGIRSLTRLLGRGTAAAAPSDTPNREQYLDDFVKNRVYYVVRRRLDQGGIVPELSENQIRKLSFAGGMMAAVARAEADIADEERVTMVATLKEHWQLDSEQAGFLADVALTQVPPDLDRFRLADGFAEMADLDERGKLADVLFAVAAADGDVGFEETESIRAITNAMMLPHDRFIEAKLKAGETSRS